MVAEPIERNVTGWLKQPEDTRDFNLFTYHPELLEGAVPDSYDLPMPPGGNQLSLGSCVFWMVLRLFRYALLKQGGSDEWFSVLAAYYLGRAIHGWEQQDTGAYIRDGIKVLADYGAIPESFYPYVIQNFRNPPSAEALAEGLKHQALRYMSIPNTPMSVRAAIAGGFPVGFGIPLYQNFPQGNGVLIIPDPVGSVIGGHAMDWRGYSKTHRRTGNQWGDSWGVNGTAWMSEAYAAKGDDLWTIELVEFDKVTPEPNVRPFYLMRKEEYSYFSDGTIWYADLTAKPPPWA